MSLRERARAAVVTVAFFLVALPALADEFVPAGNLVEPRRAHCATLLEDGRIFVAGGNSVSLDFPLASAEIYDPVSETSQPAGTMTSTRGRDPVCVALDDGNRVLVMGGATARFTYTSTAEVFDLSTGVFTAVGSMTSPRTAFTAYKRADGKVLAFGGIREGGFGTATPNVDLFDPSTNTFSLVGTLLGARHDHSAQLLQNGEILLVGGKARFNLQANPVAEVYDPADNTSRATAGPVLFEPRDRSIESVRLGDGRVVIMSGKDLPAEIYDPATDSFAAVPGSPLFSGGTFGHSVALADGRALFLGFARSPAVFSGRLAEIFDPATGEFTEIPFQAASICGGFRAVRVADNTVIVLGGGDLGGNCEAATSLVERFVALRQILIDIKPGSDPNSVNPGASGVIPVAILTTSTLAGEPLDFDAQSVDQGSLAFGPGLAPIAHPAAHPEDVDGDGDVDLVVHFWTAEAEIACGDTEAILTGQTLAGLTIAAVDSVRTTGCGTAP